MTNNDENLELSALTERVHQLEDKLDQVIGLLSDVYRYGRLRDYLLAQDFKAADQETIQVMLEVVGHRSQETITPDEVMQFPCSIIQLIDQLWLKHSNGRFGFSVQKEIYIEAGGTDDISRIDMDVLFKAGDALGHRENGQWLEYDQLDFSLNAPKGCFPAGWWVSPYGAKMAVYFAAQVMACGL